jgi:hypothetical protein
VNLLARDLRCNGRAAPAARRGSSARDRRGGCPSARLPAAAETRDPNRPLGLLVLSQERAQVGLLGRLGPGVVVFVTHALSQQPVSRLDPQMEQLGWRGKWRYDSPEVVALRDRLQAEAGIPGIELVCVLLQTFVRSPRTHLDLHSTVCDTVFVLLPCPAACCPGLPNGTECSDPAQPGFAQRAAALFRRDNCVLVKDCLDSHRLERVRAGCAHTITKMLQHDPGRVGSRGSHRYTFSSAPIHFGRVADWALLIDPPPVTAVLQAIFESPHYKAAAGPGRRLRAWRRCGLPGAAPRSQRRLPQRLTRLAGSSQHRVLRLQ